MKEKRQSKQDKKKKKQEISRPRGSEQNIRINKQRRGK
jgi:hypothetical protein